MKYADDVIMILLISKSYFGDMSSFHDEISHLRIGVDNNKIMTVNRAETKIMNIYFSQPL